METKGGRNSMYHILLSGDIANSIKSYFFGSHHSDWCVWKLYCGFNYHLYPKTYPDFII